MDILLIAVKVRVQIMTYLSKITGSRKIRNYFVRKRLSEFEFSVFSNNCCGGVFLHDANKRFNTPTVNLATNGDGFIKFLSNPESFYSGEFEERVVKKPFPVGVLNGMCVSFVHYKTLEEGKEKWKERAKRVLNDHIYVIATGHNGMETPHNMELFDQLPYKHKVMFTFGKWEQYDWAKQVKHSHGKDIPFTGIVTLTGKRFYETAKFDLSRWIRRCELENQR
jgi:uncharacterized protein (DUF1919 family)